MKRAIYTDDLPDFMITLFRMKNESREVELVEYIEPTEPGRIRMAKIRHRTDPHSVIAILAGREGDENLPMCERLVPASRIQEIEGDV